MEELRKRAQTFKTQGKFNEAIEIYSKICTPDSEKWLGWEYAYCLKKQGEIDRAIEVSKSVYQKDKKFKHNNDILAWLLFEKYFKEMKDIYCYEEINRLFNITKFVTDIIAQDDNTPYARIIIKMLKILKKHANNPDDKILFLLDKIDDGMLSEKAHTFTKNNRENEYQSDKEMYYSYKTKALFDKRQYTECIKCCDKALQNIEVFHHDNDIWIMSRKALCIGKIESVNKAIEELKALSLLKTHWSLYSEIAHLYKLNNDNANALLYFCRAAITSDVPQMKVTLYYDMAVLLESMGDSFNANLHALFAKNIRENENWNIPSELYSLLKKLQKKEEYKDIKLFTLQNFWLSKIYDILGEYEGVISSIHKNGKFGFVSNGNSSYYFKVSSTVGRYRPKQGDKINFCLIDSYNKSRNETTKEAAYIKIYKNDI